MGKPVAEGMVSILLFLCVLRWRVEADLVIYRNPDLTLNSSDWNNALLRSWYRANALISRLQAGSGNTVSRYSGELTERGTVPIVSGNADGTSYTVSVGFGTPAKYNVKLNFDIAQDVSWLRCDYRVGSCTYKRLDCHSCDRRGFADLGCNKRKQCILQAEYLNGEQVTSHISEDTLWLGSQPFEKFIFGCGYNFRNYRDNSSIGLLALSKYSLSLPSQAGRRIFSYCLPNFFDAKAEGKLRVGLDVYIPPNTKFTPMLSNPIATSWYFVGITGITVGNTRLHLRPEIFQFTSTGGGTILDSAVLISHLVQPAYDALKAAFVRQFHEAPPLQKSNFPLDTCYNYPGDLSKLNPPSITYHFQGGLDLPIIKEAILSPVSETVICLAFQPSLGAGLSIIGALQQQGYTVSFDQYRKSIGFGAVSTCS